MLSLIVPVFNEQDTLGQVLCMVSRIMPDVAKEIVVVDDCSTDGTAAWLHAAAPGGARHAAAFLLDATGALHPDPHAHGPGTSIVVLQHPRNRGKGAAIRTGLARISGDVVVIQDADLEYDPNDLVGMHQLIAVRGVADVVYGSRFYGRPHRSLNFHHYVANRTISLIFNILFNQTLTDVECCYKMMRTDLARAMMLTDEGFGIEIEISACLARQRHLRIYETGISYFGRTYAEGKKIGWRDGVEAFWCLLKYRLRPLRAMVRHP